MSVTQRLVFDPADVNTLASSGNVGAYLRSGLSGALITHQPEVKASAGTFVFVDADVAVGTDEIASVAHGLNTGDLVQLTSDGVLPDGLALLTDYYVIRVDADTIKLAASSLDAENGLAVDITAAAGGGNHTVTGLEQDYRALDVWIRNASIDIGNTVTVEATDLDIRDLTHVSDSVSLGDGTTLYTGTTVNSDHGLDVNIINPGDIDIDDSLANVAIENSALAVSETALAIVSSALADRKWLWLANEGNKSLYWGKAGVTAANGFPLHPGMQHLARVGAAVVAQVIGRTGALSEDLRVMELS